MATNLRPLASFTSSAKTASSVPSRYRRWIRIGVLVAAAVFLGAGLWSLRWSGARSTATPDTFWYARDAMRYAGYSEAHADSAAARITCGAMSRARPHVGDYDGCLAYRRGLPASAPARFERIFTSRPGYALLTAPFVRVFGGAGFVAGTAVLGTACGVAIALVALAIGLGPMRALLAEVAFYLLPTGLWVSRMLAEAPMVLFLLIAVLGVILLLRGRGRDRVAASGLVAAGLVCLCVTKPANGVALAVALAAGSAVMSVFTRQRSAYLLLGGIAMVVLAGNLCAGAALHLPGVHETLQDTFTRHFRRPDVADPWHRLAHLAWRLWDQWIPARMRDDPLIPAAYLLGVVGLFARTRPYASLPLLVAGLTGTVVVTMHPLVSELPRLTVVTWIPVAFGLAALAAPSRSFLATRDETDPHHESATSSTAR